jgi:ubiquinone/menaquinone biosynthesis C-methylase UbiE
MLTPRQLKTLYEQGKNVSEILREEMEVDHNTKEIIEISYDLQAGSYTKALNEKDVAERKKRYCVEIVKTIRSLCQPQSILEAGVGEATTYSGVLLGLEQQIPGYAFDLSWSRVAYARRWLENAGVMNATLSTGSLLQLPYADNSVDVVYTSHSIEPNGGYEEIILRELYRVAARYVILLEPGYELASNEARERMDSHGYCKNLRGISESLGYDVIEHTLFRVTSNPLNPTALTIIRKSDRISSPDYVLACPKYKTPLEEIGGMMFSAEALVVYPIIAGIPCLRIENGIFASKYGEIMKSGCV